MNENTVVGLVHRQVKIALSESGLVDGKHLVLAVSGGQDSLAMLYSFAEVQGEFGLRLHGAHVDHGLRVNASRHDANFVTETFRNLGISYTSESIDVKAFQREHRLSLEEAARNVRYSFLAKVAQNISADAVVVAHTLDDQAETILMHIIRGSGLTGLRGMQLISSNTFEGESVTLVRPLLSVSRKDTAEYCFKRGLRPRLDESNLSAKFHRNRIRMDLMPKLEVYNPAIRTALVRLSRSAAMELEYLDVGVDDVWEDAVSVRHRYLTLETNIVKRLPVALQSHLLRRALDKLKGNTVNIEHTHIQAMESLIHGPAGRSLDLPEGLRFTVEYGLAKLFYASEETYPLPLLEGQHLINIPGETLVSGWRIIADLDGSDATSLGLMKGSCVHTARFGYKALGDSLWMRAREPGDRFQPLGMPHMKKLQDFMIDAKIPFKLRDRVPLIVSKRGIVWVAGWRIADWAKEDNDKGPTLELRLDMG